MTLNIMWLDSDRFGRLVDKLFAAPPAIRNAAKVKQLLDEIAKLTGHELSEEEEHADHAEA